MYVIKTFGS
ncbi:hypothetical protein LEMLEM_LOCUS1000 [Lemmus lemmus]